MDYNSKIFEWSSNEDKMNKLIEKLKIKDDILHLWTFKMPILVFIILVFSYFIFLNIIFLPIICSV